MPPPLLLPWLLPLTVSRVCRCAAAEQVGDWLSAWISLGGALSAVGLLNTLLCTAARVCVSAARISVLPRCLATLDERGLPRRATLAIAVVLAFACALPFSELVSISMLFYGVTTAIEFLALVKLRYSEAQTPRPFRIPIGRLWLPLACTPPILLCMLLVALAPVEAWVAFLFATVRAPIRAPVTLHSVLARSPRSVAQAPVHGALHMLCWWRRGPVVVRRAVAQVLSTCTYYLAHDSAQPVTDICWRPSPAANGKNPVVRRPRRGPELFLPGGGGHAGYGKVRTTVLSHADECGSSGLALVEGADSLSPSNHVSTPPRQQQRYPAGGSGRSERGADADNDADTDRCGGSEIGMPRATAAIAAGVSAARDDARPRPQ